LELDKKMKIKRLITKIWKFVYKLPFFNRVILRGTKLEAKNSFLYHCKFDCKGKNNRIYICEGVLRGCIFYIRGDNNNIIIKQGLRAKNAEFWIQNDCNTITIGENTCFAGRVYFDAQEGSTISIGDNCLFSIEVIFRTGDCHSILDMNNNRINASENIEIGNHVWIGYDVKVNKGAKISSNSIVGTGSIVTRKIEQENVVIAGVPAKIVKEGVNWCTDKIPIKQVLPSHDDSKIKA